jgi:hypothetical protein
VALLGFGWPVSFVPRNPTPATAGNEATPAHPKPGESMYFSDRRGDDFEKLVVNVPTCSPIGLFSKGLRWRRSPSASRCVFTMHHGVEHHGKVRRDVPLVLQARTRLGSPLPCDNRFAKDAPSSGRARRRSASKCRAMLFPVP